MNFRVNFIKKSILGMHIEGLILGNGNQSIITQRLSFIKYLYEEGLEQAKKEEPSCAIAILTFHDAVENFLLLCAENTDAYMRENRGFMSYWNKLERSSGKRLAEEATMNRLNRARNNLKHNGIIPIKFHVEEFRNSVTCFFEKNTPTFFGFDFLEIDIEEHKRIAPIEKSTTLIRPKIERRKKNIPRKIYSFLLPTKATRSVYPIYILSSLISSWIISGVLFIFPLNLIPAFGILNWLVWTVLAPFLTLLVFIDPNNSYFSNYLDFIDGNLITIGYLVLISIIYITISLFVGYLSIEEERERKTFFPTVLRELLEQNQYIGINILSEYLNVSEKVIFTWLDMINPNYQIEIVKHLIKTMQRSISDEEINDLMQKLKEAQLKVDKMDKNDNQ